eukprot:m.310249 g.310249  ORF g.310249 m.310249 type:complete len:695 (+) comp16474_c1_seq2:136-2220(+)
MLGTFIVTALVAAIGFGRDDPATWKPTLDKSCHAVTPNDRVINIDNATLQECISACVKMGCGCFDVPLTGPGSCRGTMSSIFKASTDRKAYANHTLPPPPPPPSPPPVMPFTLHPLLGDNAVLQRAPSKASIYGWATEAGATITVLFRGQTYESTVEPNSTHLGSLMWNVELPPTPASTTPENITISGLGAEVIMENVLFGDVWMCGGQSNMGVPLEQTFEWFHPDVCNDTSYPINLLKFPHINGLNDSTIHVMNDEPIPWMKSNYTNLATFSAVCYYFGKSLYRHMAADGEIIPMGMVMNEWGGSLIEAWVPDNSPATGELYCSDQSRHNRTGRTPGKLYNSMIVPVSNLTIRGWIWYQGEQDAGNPGSYLNKTGYACLLPALDDSWRHAFRQGSSSDPNFPIGVVSLHGWCGEEEAYCTLNPAERTDWTAAIRWAQTADWGFLPNPRLPNNFVAMGYDQPDPRNGTHCYWNTTSQTCQNVPYPQSCISGKEICPPPAGLEGGNIHPRNKLLLGDRIARAAKAIAYGDTSIAFTGPVVTGCVDNGGKLTVSFNDILMRGESLRIKVTRGFEVRSASTGNWSWVPIATPLGVQQEVEVVVDTSSVVSSIDAVRYNWLDNIACPDAYCDYTKPLINQSCANGGSPHHRHDTDLNFWWCFNPTEKIALYTAESDLPAPPFILDVVQGKCVMPGQAQ